MDAAGGGKGKRSAKGKGKGKSDGKAPGADASQVVQVSDTDFCSDEGLEGILKFFHDVLAMSLDSQTLIDRPRECFLLHVETVWIFRFVDFRHSSLHRREPECI